MRPDVHQDPGGILYLAFVKDVFSRFITGFQLADNLRPDLVLDALEMAAQLRRPGPDAELVHHSDRGSQYTSTRYTQRLEDLRIAPSVGSVGDAYDNAMAESFVSTLKRELVKGRVFSWRSRCSATPTPAGSGHPHSSRQDEPL